MRESRRREILTAGVLVAPFVAVYGWLFVYPTIQMVILSFTNSPLDNFDRSGGTGGRATV